MIVLSKYTSPRERVTVPLGWIPWSLLKPLKTAIEVEAEYLISKYGISSNIEVSIESAGGGCMPRYPNRSGKWGCVTLKQVTVEISDSDNVCKALQLAAALASFILRKLGGGEQ